MQTVCLALKTLTLTFAVLGVGCGGAGVKTHPVSGKVEVEDGEVAMLTGSTLELQPEGDDSLRPYGNIDSTGNFTVKTHYKGQLIAGAPAGKYKARIILGDESDEGVPKRKGKGNPIHPRFLDFNSSGLSISVPSGDYNVSLSKK